LKKRKRRVTILCKKKRGSAHPGGRKTEPKGEKSAKNRSEKVQKTPYKGGRVKGRAKAFRTSAQTMRRRKKTN